MSIRLLAAWLVLLGTLWFGGATARAQGQTDQDLFNQGIAQYQAQQYGEARATLRQVDPRQLADLKDREAYFEALIAIDQNLGPAAGEAPTPAEPAEPAEPLTPPNTTTAPPPEATPEAAPEVAPEVTPEVTTTPTPEAAAPTAEQRLAQAQAQAEAGNLSAAADGYASVVADDDATPATRDAATAGLAQLGRMNNPAFTRAKAAYDRGAGQFKAGDYAGAKTTLEAINPADLDNQWFYVEGRSRMIAASQASLAAADAQAQADQAAANKADADAATAATTAAAATAQAAQQKDLFAQARALYAQQEVAAGQAAQNQGHYKLAINHYNEALALEPDNAQAQNLLAAAVAANNTQVAPRSAIEVEKGNRTLLREAALVEYNHAMDQARLKLGQSDYAAASDQAENAKTTLDRNQQLFTTGEYKSFRNAAQTLSSQVLTAQAQAEAQAMAQAEKDSIVEAKNAADQARARRDAEVLSLLKQALVLRTDQNYKRALELVNQALFIDPTNVAGQAMKVMIEDAMVLTENRKARRAVNLESAQLAVQNTRATIPYDDLLTYPTDWPQITATRMAAAIEEDGADSEANRRASRQLKEPVPINFEGNRLNNVIDYLRNTTGANFFVNWPALESVGVEPDSPVSLQLTNVPAEQALRLVLQQVGEVAEFDPIGYSLIEGVVTVDTQRNLKKTTDTRVYDIRDLLVQVPNFSNAPEFDLNSALSNTSSGGSGGGGGGGGGGAGIFGDDSEDFGGDVGPSRAEMVDQIVTLIQDTVGTPEEWVDLESSMQELNGNLIVKSTPDNHRAIVGLLAQLRETRAIQIHVEARFLLVDNNFLENFNIDLDFSYVATGNFGPVVVEQDSIAIADTQTTALTPSNLTAGRALDLSVSYLDDLSVDLLIQATQAHQRSLALTAPRVTFFNGQRAYVMVARQVAFISDLEPVPDAGGFDVTLSVVQSGVLLDVEGTISNDRRYVTLTLRPSVASLKEPIKTIPVGGGVVVDDNGVVVAFLDGAFIEAPELELTQVRCTVSIPDRGTLLVGGQRLVGEIDVEAGVPVLSKVPVLNRLFTNTTHTRDERTLLILVKPTIIIQSEQEDELFPGLLQDPDKFNIGASF